MDFLFGSRWYLCQREGPSSSKVNCERFDSLMQADQHLNLFGNGNQALLYPILTDIGFITDTLSLTKNIDT